MAKKQMEVQEVVQLEGGDLLDEAGAEEEPVGGGVGLRGVFSEGLAEEL